MHKRLLLIILTALVIVVLAGVAVSMAHDDGFTGALRNYTAGHADSGTTDALKCLECHSSGSGPDAHATHSKRLLLAFSDSVGHNGCGRCHSEGVTTGYEGDASYADTATVTTVNKQVSTDVCVRCHGGFNLEGTHAAESIASNCLACHVKGNDSGALGADVGHSETTGGVDADWINRTVVDNTSTWQFCTFCHGQDGSGGVVSNRVFFETTETNPNTWP